MILIPIESTYMPLPISPSY